MSKISYSVMKKLKLDRLLKRQANFDQVIVFDEEFEIKYNHYGNKHYWLTFVDFCSTYKYDPNVSCLKTASYKDIVDKANEWIRQLPQYRHRDRLVRGQPIWSVINCETLYAKISINFAESGEITRKRVMQFSKWPLNDELFMNLYCEGNTMTQNFEQIFNGRYIVVLLRVWMTKQLYFPFMLIEPPPTIAIKDYWPRKITIEEIVNEKKTKKSADLRRKLRKTLSIETSHSGSHSEQKECLEKIHEITNRINEDIIKKEIDGRILNVITFPYYYNKENSHRNVSESKIEVGKIPIGHIVNLIRVFYLLKPKCEYDDNSCPKKLIGIIDFVPRCISGGGFIKYPRFETQTDIIDKATMWMTKNSQFKFLNFNSIDIKLKSMTSIDSSEMIFARNTGDFVRILRLCYLKPHNTNNHEHRTNENGLADIINWKPSPPIYLQCKNIVSINNSLKELQQQMNDYLIKVRKNEFNNDNGERWKFLCADSAAIFISNISSNSDSRNRRNNLMADCDKSFHAISISSTSMNRNMLNAINIFYDIGLLVRRPNISPTSVNTFVNNNNNLQQNNSDITNVVNDLDRNDKKNRKNHTDPATMTSTDQSSCYIV